MFQKPVEIVQRYFDAWNQHDAGAIVATFAETGSYADPVTPEEQNEVSESSRKVAMEMLAMPGFISWVGLGVGDRMMTITAWESADAMAPLMKGGEHRSAVGRSSVPNLLAAPPLGFGSRPGSILDGSGVWRVRRWPTPRRRKENAHAAQRFPHHSRIGRAWFEAPPAL
jgi:heme-degrading monooxygenase HmoA